MWYRLTLILKLLVSFLIPKPASTAPTWTNAAAMNTARYDFTPTLVPDSKVLVIGGIDASSGYLASAEVYDPDGRWRYVANDKPPAINRLLRGD